MPDASSIGSLFIDTLSGGCLTWLDGKIRSTANFQKLQSKLNRDNYAKEIKDLLDKSINLAKDALPEDLDNTILKENIETNKEIIYSWITTSDDLELSKELDKLDVLYPENKKTIVLFFKKLYLQINLNKDKYSLIIGLQIKNAIKSLSVDHTNILSSTKHIELQMEELLSQTKSSWKFSDLLNKIELKLSEGNTDASIDFAVTIEEQVVRAGNIEEIEKLYQLIVNSYLKDTSKQELAIPYLEKLIHHTSDDERRMQRNILLLIVRNDYDEAQSLIDSIDIMTIVNEDIRKKFYSLQINNLFLQKRYFDALEYLDSIKDVYNDYIFWKSQFLLIIESFEELENFYNDNNDFFITENFTILKLQFDILISIYSNKLKNNTAILDTYSEVNKLIEFSEKLLLKCGDDKIIESTIYSQRGYVYELLENTDNAKIEYLKAEELDRNNPILLRNFPIILFNSKDQNDLEKGISFLKEYIDVSKDDYYALSFYFDYAIKLNKICLKEELMTIYYNSSTPLYVKIKYIEFLSSIYQMTESLSLLSKLSEEYENDPFIFYAYGRHYQNINDKEHAIINFEKAIENKISEPFKTGVVIVLINFYLNERSEYFTEKAISLIESTYDEEFILFILREQYIECLYRKRMFVKCISLCSQLDYLNFLTPRIIRTLCSCYLSTQNYLLAIRSFEKLKEIDEIRNDDLINYASCYISIGDFDHAKELNNYMETPVEVSDFLYRCQFLIYIGECDRAIELIRDGYLKYSNNQDIMELFIKLVFQFRVQPLDEETQIAFTNCLDIYDKSDFKNKILKKFSISEDMTSEELMQTLERVAGDNLNVSFEPSKKIFIDFQQNKLPTSFLKKLENKKFLYIWYETLKNKSASFWCSYGNVEDNNEAQYIKDEIYIDLSSLLIFSKLSLIEELNKSFKKIYVTQSIINELNQVLIDKNNHLLPVNHLDLTDTEEQLYIQYDYDFYQKVWELSEKLLEFIGSSTVFEIVGEPLEIKNDPPDALLMFQRFDDLKFDIDCLMYGYETNIPVLYENSTFRKLYNGIENTTGAFSITSFLKYIAEKNKWLASKYNKIISLMINYNYYYFELDYRLFYWNIVAEGYQINNHNKKIFSLLSNPIYNKKGIFEIFIRLIIFIWFHTMTKEIKSKWTSFIINTIIIRIDVSLEEILTILNNLYRYLLNIEDKKELYTIIECYYNKFTENGDGFRK